METTTKKVNVQVTRIIELSEQANDYIENKYPQLMQAFKEDNLYVITYSETKKVSDTKEKNTQRALATNKKIVVPFELECLFLPMKYEKKTITGFETIISEHIFKA